MCKIGLFVVVECGGLDNPTNGTVMTNPGTNYTSIATYICDPGFFLEGEPTRTCLGTGTWSGSQPTCTGKTICEVTINFGIIHQQQDTGVTPLFLLSMNN